MIAEKEKIRNQGGVMNMFNVTPTVQVNSYSYFCLSGYKLLYLVTEKIQTPRFCVKKPKGALLPSVAQQ